MRRLWAERETGRYGSIVDPMLQTAKTQTAEQQRQVVPCRAGVLSAVVYSNGDVSVCETHPPVGNIRQKPFSEIWRSEQVRRLRRSIAAKECYCTNEVFLWPSIVYQPLQLVKILVQSKAWEKPEPLPPQARPPQQSEQAPLKVLQ
jgi:hypothetical protein